MPENRFITIIVYSVLRKGLNSRIFSLIPIPIQPNSWQINESCPITNEKLSFGLIINPEHAIEVLNKGPQANQPEAELFKQFWGNKSELRRFQDGSITEACVWTNQTATLKSKRSICKQIVLHLLQHHFNILPNQIIYVADQMDVAYSVASTIQIEDNNSENLALAVIQSFDEVAKNIRSLKDIPLDVHSILGHSAVMRYCEIEPILPQATFDSRKLVFHSPKVVEGVIQFGKFISYFFNYSILKYVRLGVSGKWPEDLSAIRRIKAAFCLRIAKGLNEQFRLITRGNSDSIELIKGKIYCYLDMNQKII